MNNAFVRFLAYVRERSPGGRFLLKIIKWLFTSGVGKKVVENGRYVGWGKDRCSRHGWQLSAIKGTLHFIYGRKQIVISQEWITPASFFFMGN
jgi:hypothetical protein